MKFTAPIRRIRNPFVIGLIYGIGISGATVSSIVAFYNVTPDWHGGAIVRLALALILLAALAVRIPRLTAEWSSAKSLAEDRTAARSESNSDPRDE